MGTPFVWMYNPVEDLNRLKKWNNNSDYVTKTYKITLEGNHQIWGKGESSLSYTHDILPTEMAKSIYTYLTKNQEVDWKKEGHDWSNDGSDIRRQISYWGAVPYAYGRYRNLEMGTRLNKNILKPIVKDILRHLNNETGYMYNAMIATDYVSGEVMLPFHSDDERSLDKDTPILTISLGDIRTLTFKCILKEGEGVYYDVPMINNSGIFMLGKTNDQFIHGLMTKGEEMRKRRISLTFRRNLEGPKLLYITTDEDRLNKQAYERLNKRKVTIYYPNMTTNLKKLKEKYEAYTSDDPDWITDSKFWNQQ